MAGMGSIMELLEADARVRYWGQGKPGLRNFGDFLSSLFMRTAAISPRVPAEVYRLIGSVINSHLIRDDIAAVGRFSSAKIAFWGCGMRESTPLTQVARDSSIFCGVRGPLTRDALGLPSDTVLGDPGLILPLIHPMQRHPETAGRVIGIPHVADPNRDSEDLRASSGVDTIVLPTVEPNEAALRVLLNKIASASFVLSGSLHGAVVAAAYGVPFAFWDTGFVDLPFKWNDFAASINIASRFVSNFTEGEAFYHDEACKALRLPPVLPILDVCPFNVRPPLLMLAASRDLEPGADLEAVFQQIRNLRSVQDPEVERNYASSFAAYGRHMSGLHMISRSARRRIHRIRN